MFSFRSSIQVLLTVFLVFSLSGCALGRYWKNLVRGGPPPQERPVEPAMLGPSYSRNQNVMTGKERRYKRVTRSNFSEEEQTQENAGSLWKKEGQGSFLFSQNNLRVLGDIVNVQIEGKAAENLDAKVKIIKKALARRFGSPVLARAPASNPGAPGAPAQAQPSAPGQAPAKEGAPDATAAQAAAQPPPALANNSQAADKDGADVDGKMDNVTCRIVEKNSDGSYRIKGSQTMYVQNYEYKLIVTGIARPDDISTTNISSAKLLDSKFDLVATNKDMMTGGGR